MKINPTFLISLISISRILMLVIISTELRLPHFLILEPCFSITFRLHLPTLLIL
ncbi:hypothetical protein KR49_14005 [Synechococcus sp. KORDI-49]|nr:hypothetical protein KR49_14005 [Synechococcus sp. KORDI-49]